VSRDGEAVDSATPLANDETVAVTKPEIPEPAPRFSYSEDRYFLVLAIFIGVVSGLAVVCFRLTIEYTRIRLLGESLYPPVIKMLLAPTLAGLVVGLLVMVAFPRVRGSGVNQTKAALYIYDGYIPFRTAVGKFITSALAIGSGQSLGPEDPSLQIGATIASSVGRYLKLSREKLRLIAPVGAAAGLAAAFNAPISAVLFVIEEVIGRWSAGILGAVVLSAISSVVVSRWFFGSEPLFRIPPVQLVQPVELLAYAVLGVVGGIASLVFAKSIGYLRPKMKALPRWTQFVQPALAGLIIGAIGWLGFPQVMGAGYDYIDAAMHDQFPWKVLAILAGLKILSTTLSFVSGTPGGMFAPTLFIGAMLGGAVGGLERQFVPHLSGSIGTYALVGMGVLFAGFLRAPFTSVFMVLEVSGNYSIIIPVIIANTLSYVISRTFQRVPIFEVLTKQDGLELPSMEEQREERILRVEDAMRPTEVPVFDGTESTADAVLKMGAAATGLGLVRMGNHKWGLLFEDRLVLAKPGATVRDAIAESSAEGELAHIYPDHPLETAMKYLQKWPLLPVVHRADPAMLLGTIAMRDVAAAYRTTAEEESD
jgi:chloride channel protein, CIC family